MKDRFTTRRPEELTDDEIINALSGVDIPAEDIEISPQSVSISYDRHYSAPERENDFEQALYMGIVLKNFFLKNSEPLRQRITELENAVEKALDALENFEEFDTVLAKAYLREVVEPKALKKPFKVGDKVRIILRAEDAAGIELFYSNVPYDTIEFINERGVHQLRYGADNSLSQHPWNASDLEHYRG